MKFSYMPGIEGFIIELSLGLIFGIVSYNLFPVGMAVIGIPLAILSFGCLLTAIISIYFFFKESLSK